MRFHLVSLGCPKNQWDADVLAKTLLDGGHRQEPNPVKADVVLINTCGFIDSAKEEAIGAILDAAAVRSQYNSKLKIVVTGCLAQRYGEEMLQELPEADAVVDIGANPDILSIVQRVQSGVEKPFHAAALQNRLPLTAPRIITTPGHYAYLKIAEGCSNRCHYCAIPLIRGPLRSRPMEDCLEEARWLAAQGVKELILVAQDITAYGEDLYGEAKLPALLRQLEEVGGIAWIRLLYTYPDRITDALIETMAKSEKILPYLDLPLQHVNTRVLNSMNRPGGRSAVESAVKRLRQGVPGITLRTTFITGYPGETEAEFEELYQFIKETRFDRLGCFAYSEEEGTPAAAMEQVPEEMRRQRVDAIMELQTGIMAEKQKALIGTVQQVICDGPGEEKGVYLCRTKADAPDIDGLCYVKSAVPIAPGAIFPVRITGAELYDLFAEPLEGKAK